MKRGTRCVAQTINLSNPETCVRPKRIQKLVHADMMQPCPSIVAGGSSYWTPRPVPIKICTRKDMQRTCPPKLCECPQKTSPKTSGYRFCNILLFLVKSSIAAGLVYWTHTEGLWGSSADVEDLYRRIMATIAPTLDDREVVTHDDNNVNFCFFSIHGNCYVFTDRIASHKRFQEHDDTEVQLRLVYHNELYRERVDDAAQAASTYVGRRRTSQGRAIQRRIFRRYDGYRRGKLTLAPLLNHTRQIPCVVLFALVSSV
ncbi:uncharacterized protein LOC100746026 isoform X1 [Bombus impatiens]|uniref:MICOS complex subunit MIC13 n=1 Tax=Bombus impatiens TaxID=132113 RepID=A0A6P8L860_BOMIM|nr:uncharacterized protein LOC100746026 isoform X1 [Bombus impatiens]